MKYVSVLTSTRKSLKKPEDNIKDLNFINDVETSDIVALPTQTDYLTEKDEADDNFLGVVEVNDVPGELEL